MQSFAQRCRPFLEPYVTARWPVGMKHVVRWIGGLVIGFLTALGAVVIGSRCVQRRGRRPPRRPRHPRLLPQHVRRQRVGVPDVAECVRMAVRRLAEPVVHDAFDLGHVDGVRDAVRRAGARPVVGYILRLQLGVHPQLTHPGTLNWVSNDITWAWRSPSTAAGSRLSFMICPQAP